jgi:hypothetical protein
MSSEVDVGDFIPRDDIPLCDMTDHNVPLPTIARAYDVIDRSVTISFVNRFATRCSEWHIISDPRSRLNDCVENAIYGWLVQRPEHVTSP